MTTKSYPTTCSPASSRCRDFDPTIPCDEAEAARWATAMTLARRNRCGYDHAHCLSPLPALDARGS